MVKIVQMAFNDKQIYTIISYYSLIRLYPAYIHSVFVVLRENMCWKTNCVLVIVILG